MYRRNQRTEPLEVNRIHGLGDVLDNRYSIRIGHSPWQQASRQAGHSSLGISDLEHPHPHRTSVGPTKISSDLTRTLRRQPSAGVRINNPRWASLASVDPPPRPHRGFPSSSFPPAPSGHRTLRLL